jgi:hypothetical protein
MTQIANIPVPPTIKLHLSAQEAQQVADLFDLAVKAGGLQAALIAVPLIHKLQQAANPAAQE